MWLARLARVGCKFGQDGYLVILDKSLHSYNLPDLHTYDAIRGRLQFYYSTRLDSAKYRTWRTA